MIAMLLLMLVGLFGVSGSTVTESSEPVLEDTPPVNTLDRVDVQRTGGIAYQELSATITDRETLSALRDLLPSPLPAVERPGGGCADCWEYRVVLDLASVDEDVVLEFDQASEPPELAAFVDALDDELE
jgi:hypothetical protein